MTGTLALAAATAVLVPGSAAAQQLTAPEIHRSLIAATSAAAVHQAAVPARYTVRSGDTLSMIAGKLFGNPKDWPRLYDANLSVVGGNPNRIYPGESLAEALGPRAAYGSQPAAVHVVAAVHQAAGSGRAWGVTYGYPNYCGDGDGDGWDVACQARSAPVSAHRSYQTASYSGGGYSGGTPGGAFGQCVVARESGGNAQVMNASGHYGLYQFAYGTWVAYGGSPASFGHASVAEQEQVFANALARGGQSNWSPYDGC